MFIWQIAINKLKQMKNPIKYAREIGVTIGENCRLIGTPNWGSEPWLISIGNHCLIVSVKPLALTNR